MDFFKALSPEFQLAAGLLIWLAIFFPLLRFRRSRHQRRIHSAKKVLKKIRTFQDPGKAGKVFSYLRKINAFAFEELLLSAFKDQGYTISRNKRYTGDGGIDGRIYKDGKKYLVQAKRYAGPVAVQHVSEFAEVVARHKAAGGFFVHTGQTPQSCFEVALQSNLEIISGERLLKLLQI